ncbi:hypothetical protein RISK_003416 [Rhodopirellula islandica]|uniref:Uncharacterized protein n=1 Tax=Rhodopirellula islandica TaxID=595434 RepID=A0A0J1BCM8_RHOIS|nr:hypothetical protein RISK_003416 [Rhodopirellula islandica]
MRPGSRIRDPRPFYRRLRCIRSNPLTPPDSDDSVEHSKPLRPVQFPQSEEPMLLAKQHFSRQSPSTAQHMTME